MIPTALDIGLNLLWGVVILGLGWWAAGLLGRWVRRLAQRSERIRSHHRSHVLHDGRLDRARVFTLIAVLAQFGVRDGSSIIAVLGAAGLAVGLALQGTLQNIAAGIMPLMLRPIRAEEYVALSSGSEGTVEEVGLFLTRLVQGDGIHGDAAQQHDLERHHHQLQPQRHAPFRHGGWHPLWRRPGPGHRHAARHGERTPAGPCSRRRPACGFSNAATTS